MGAQYTLTEALRTRLESKVAVLEAEEVEEEEGLDAVGSSFLTGDSGLGVNPRVAYLI